MRRGINLFKRTRESLQEERRVLAWLLLLDPADRTIEPDIAQLDRAIARASNG